MNKPLILVVEDDVPVRNLITTTLKAHDYRFLTAANGESAILEASSHNPEIILLDLGLPDMDGIEVIRKVRTWSNLPIIVISARSEDTDKIEALDAGADDYLTKPFSVEELLARLRVTQRRLAAIQAGGMANADSVFTNGKLKVDYAAGCAYMDGQELHLTPSEYKLLCLLSKNVGKVLTHTFIAQQIWNRSWDNDIASLRVFMATLRKKLEKEPGSPQYIQTHIGVGYRMLKVEYRNYGGGSNMQQRGRVTIPTDVDVVPETLTLMERWGADAIRDCDGTDYPEELRAVDAKVYSTYYTTRKDNTWAKAHPEEIQQMYIMTPFYTAVDGDLQIHLMTHLYPDMLKVNNRDDITRWWEVIDRTTGAVVSTSQWSYDETTGDVTIHKPEAFHSYTVSFLAYIMWDPVHMYNAVTNGWKDVEKQITFDVRQPKTHTYSMERLRRFIAEHPYVDVIRYTTFFHQFTLIFDELAREKYVDWYGYSASVSPYILEQFEKEVGYRFRPEFIIDQGYMNNTYRVPSKEFQDFQAFQRREVAKLAKEMVDITHACGKEAMMFLGDHWIGMEPFMEEFQTIGLDAVVGSVGNGATLRLISDIEGVRYTEGRFLPYFFPDTFHEGGDPTREAKVNWVTARRAILRKPIDRIGYGGYLKLATQFPDFIDYVESVCKEFRELYENIKGTTPYCVKRVAILNCWGKMRAWGNHMVHHAIYYKQNYSYAGIIEALSGAPFDVKFISFDDIRNHPDLLDSFDVVLNVGDAYTAYTGGDNWKDEAILTAVRRFVYRGGGFIGVGEPASCQWQGHFFQLADILGVEEETGYTLNVDKYNWQDHAHFITEDSGDAIDFGEGKKNIFALESATVLRQIDKGVQLAVNTFGQGRGVYISGLPYSFANSRLLYRAILWAASAEGKIHRWFSTNYNVEVHAYVKNGKYCVVNNTYEPQQTTVYRGDGSSFAVDLAANAILWYEI